MILFMLWRFFLKLYEFKISMSFSVRIVNLDFYMSSPIQGLDVMYSEFRGSSVNQVPVLRLFGSTITGNIKLHFN